MLNSEQEKPAKVNTKQQNTSGGVNKSTSTPPAKIGDEVLLDFIKFDRELEEKLSDKTKTVAELEAIEIDADIERSKLMAEYMQKMEENYNTLVHR